MTLLLRRCRSVAAVSSAAHAVVRITQALLHNVIFQGYTNLKETMLDEDEKHRKILGKHNSLVRRWQKEKGRCIVCGLAEGVTSDHLPPKGLFPRTSRGNNPGFLTFPVCKECNGGTSDSDYLLGVYLAIYLNQESYIAGDDPVDNDLLALHNEAIERLKSKNEGEKRRKLLEKHLYYNEDTGTHGLNPDKLEINKTLVKIAKAIYWLDTDGEILQDYDLGWWIFPRINTSSLEYIEGHLRTTDTQIHWGNRFITHYTAGAKRAGVGGVLSCSLHFYTNRNTGSGATWHLLAAPKKTKISGRSLFETAYEKYPRENYQQNI